MKTSNNKGLAIRPDSASSLEIKTMEDALKLAEMLSRSQMVPDQMRGKSGDILAAILMGREVGTPPMQSLQNIAVINGRPCMWGDLVMGLVKASSVCEYVKENTTEEIRKQGYAVCKAKRKGAPEVVQRFTLEDAKKARLFDKKFTPWHTYPERMLQMRARSWALRDAFADVLKGLRIREEEEDIPEQATEPEFQEPQAVADESAEKDIRSARPQSTPRSQPVTDEADKSYEQPAAPPAEEQSTTDEPDQQELPTGKQEEQPAPLMVIKVTKNTKTKLFSVATSGGNIYTDKEKIARFASDASKNKTSIRVNLEEDGLTIREIWS